MGQWHCNEITERNSIQQLHHISVELLQPSSILLIRSNAVHWNAGSETVW